MLVFVINSQTIWALINLIILILLIISIFVLGYNQNQIAKSIFLLLKDYNVITINKEITELYNKETIIQAAKNNIKLDLSTGCEKSFSEEYNARHTSAIELLKNYPDLKRVTKVKQNYTINELILDYQKDIIKICNENIPSKYIKYETTDPIGKTERID